MKEYSGTGGNVNLRYCLAASMVNPSVLHLDKHLSFRPSVLLLDEPLNALDETTRYEMHDLLKKVKDKSHVRTLHVTYSVADAEALADRRLTLVDGQISEFSSTPVR